MTLPSLYPLLFEPVYKDYLWGGNRISQRYQRANTPDPCAESWELADRPEGMSIVANGELKGKTLHELVNMFGESLLGSRHAQCQTFPLLIKIIDARKDLSVQVHPNDENAHLTGGEPKTEMWYLLDSTKGASIYTGMKPGTDRATFETAMTEGTLANQILAKVPATPGRAIFVPGGQVHAIGAGCLILEIQQNSNTTYRVYDWDRKDAKGNSRELHLEQALQVIEWDQNRPQAKTPVPDQINGKNQHFNIIDCPFFQTSGYKIEEPLDLRHAGESFQILFVNRGKILVGANGNVTAADEGTTVLIPANLTHTTVSPIQGQAAFILATA